MELEITKNRRPNATYLQGIAGYATGTPAGDLKPGDHIVFNHESVSQVLEIARETPKMIEVVLPLKGPYGDDLGTSVRRFKKSRIVARPVEELPNE